MAEGEVTRRLAAIVPADVAGYSRLTAADEEGTLAALRAHRAELTDPKIAEHGGRIANTAGDSLLIEFPSVVEALRCALEIQAGMAGRNAEITAERRIEFRVGINLGDVVEQAGDLLGDGVNIAARLEGLAEPGGICLSDDAYRQVRDRVEVGFEDLGEVEVKNLARPVHVYRVLGEGAPRPAPRTRRRPNHWRRGLHLMLAVMVAILLSWWEPWATRVEPVDPAKLAFALPNKPSIAVLPFDNLTGDANQEYLADSLSENIIATLARSPDLVVIARNSTFTYKNKPVLVREVAERFGVRFVLEGSVQRSGNSLRVTAQLVDAMDGAYLWAETFDRDLVDLFALQDDITQRILLAMDVQLVAGEDALNTWRGFGRDPEIYRLVKEGERRYRTFNRQGNKDAEALFRQALALQPDALSANIWMGWVHMQKAMLGLTKDPATSRSAARSFVDRILADAGESPSPHMLLAFVDMYEGNFDSALEHVNKGLQFAPSSGRVSANSGWVKIVSGRPAEGVVLLGRAMRLHPRYPQWMPLSRAFGLMMLGRNTEAAVIGEAILASPRKDSRAHRNSRLMLAAMAIFENRDADAGELIEKTLDADSHASVSLQKREIYFIKDRAFLNRFLDALRQAGLPENPPLPLPDKPSIAVLPFQNMSGDPEQAYFADGMAEDVITDLSKLGGLFVIARNSSFKYRGEGIDVKQIGRELGVRYVLEVSVRRSGDKFRINAQLIDAQSGGHLWADRYDGEIDDVFALQDRVTERIVQALSLKLTDAEKSILVRKGTENAEAYDVYLKGWASYLKGTPGDYVRAVAQLKLTITLDPSYDRARAALAQVYWSAAGREWLKPLGFKLWVEARFAVQAQLDKIRELGPVALRVKADLARYDDNFDRAVELARKALALEPGDVDSHIALAEQLRHAGKFDESIEVIEQAKRLDPKYPAAFDTALAYARFARQEFEQAAELARRALARNADDLSAYLVLIAAYGHLGKPRSAAPIVEALQAHRARVGQTPYFPNEIRSSATNTALKLSLYAGVIAAGIPIRLDWNLV